MQTDSEYVEIGNDRTDEAEGNIRDAILRALEESGLVAERFAKLATPVDTGRLRNSITHSVIDGQNSVIIGTNVEYAPYIEFGVRGRDGHHMLKRAAADHKDFYAQIFSKHLGQK